MKREYACLIRLSKQENDMLLERCAESELDKSKLIRMLIANRPVDDPPVREILEQLNFEVHKQGVNINQVVKKINEGFASPEAIEELLCMQGYVIKAFKEVTFYCHNKDGKAHKNRKQQQLVPLKKRD